MRSPYLSCVALGCVAAPALLLAQIPAAAPTRGSSITTDYAHGKMLRVYWSQVGEDDVVVETKPHVDLSCHKAATSECFAYVVTGTIVAVTVRRKRYRMITPGYPDGVPPTPAQWRDSCANNVGATCTVTMDQGRNAGINWAGI